MRKLLRAELYQNLHRRPFYYLFLLMGFMFWFFHSSFLDAIPAATIYDWMENDPYQLRLCVRILQHRYGLAPTSYADAVDLADTYLLRIFREIMAECGTIGWSMGFLSTFFIGTAFRHRTFSRAACEGYSREKIFAGKVIVFYGTTGLMSLFWFLIWLCHFYGPRGLALLTAPYLIRCLLLWLYLRLAAYGVSLLIAFACRDVLKSLLFNFLYMFLSTFLSRGDLYPVFAWVPRLLLAALNPMFLLHEWELLFAREPALSPAWIPVFLIPLIHLVGTTVGSWFLFRRTELK